MDLPFNKKIKKHKDKIKKIKDEDISITSICKKIKKSILKECFIDIFIEDEEEQKISPLPERLSPYIKNMSVGYIKLCDETIILKDIEYFKEELKKVLQKMNLLSENETESKFLVNVDIMHCNEANILIATETDLKYLIKTDLMIKYSTIKRDNGEISCEMWYQGQGEKISSEINNKVKKESLEIAYKDNLNYILDMLKRNSF